MEPRLFYAFTPKPLICLNDSQGYLTYAEPVPLLVRGEEQESNLYFPVYENSMTYIDLMIPELKTVLEQFSMPQHKWYKAQAGYDLEFVNSRKKYFNIDYDIDLNEKRDYWILQLPDKEFQELDYQNITFQVIDYNTKEIKSVISQGEIKDYNQYKIRSKQEYFTNNQEYLVKPLIHIYRKSYDILWGGTHIVFSEKGKAALEATNIITAENGLEFAEFTDYRIEMLG